MKQILVRNGATSKHAHRHNQKQGRDRRKKKKEKQKNDARVCEWSENIQQGKHTVQNTEKNPPKNEWNGKLFVFVFFFYSRKNEMKISWNPWHNQSNFLARWRLFIIELNTSFDDTTHISAQKN